jgi:adenine phosphoribosyltransferase
VPDKFGRVWHAGVMAGPRSAAREAFLSEFRWTDAHADFAGILRSASFVENIGPALVEPFEHEAVSGVVAIEARGFVLGALAAHALGVGLILARKPDAIHPGAVEQVAEDPDWRGRRLTFGISPLAIRPDDRLLLVDDWVETGSQARTVSSLVTFLGGTLVGVSAIVDHASVETRHELGLVGLLRSTELPSYTGT